MALSNILNEPRREITESLVGVVGLALAVAGPLCLDWWFATWVSGGQYNADFWVTAIIGPPLLVIVLFALFWIVAGFLLFTHFVGEEICDLLDDFGLRLRPVRPDKRGGVERSVTLGGGGGSFFQFSPNNVGLGTLVVDRNGQSFVKNADGWVKAGPEKSGRVTL